MRVRERPCKMAFLSLLGYDLENSCGNKQDRLHPLETAPLDHPGDNEYPFPWLDEPDKERYPEC